MAANPHSHDNQTQPTNVTREVVITPATRAGNLQPSPISNLSRKHRQELRFGKLVEIIALHQPTGQRVLAGAMPLKAIRASFTVVDQHLTSLEAQALQEIIRFLDFNIRSAHGALGNFQGTPADEQPLYRHMRLREVATAIGFRHVVEQMDYRINSTFYKGGLRKYKLPIDDAESIFKTTFDTPFSLLTKQKLVDSVVRAYLDDRLKNNPEVEALMRKCKAFGRAVNAEESRVKQAKAQKDVEQKTDNVHEAGTKQKDKSGKKTNTTKDA